MIRLTVLYNLPPDQDEDEFLKWRLGEHQLANMSMEGVIASEFHKVLGDAAGGAPAYRFLTTVDWAGRESFEKGFYDPQVQAGLKENMEKISDPLFLVSERLIGESSDTRRGNA
jgi:hypothetical protein